MKKTFEQTGINGTFKGLVEVLFNYRKEDKEVHNRSTHDEEMRTFSYHRVIGFVEGERFESDEFQNENLVWQYIEEIEKKVNAKLHQLANVPKVKTLTEQLKDKGYE